MAIFKIPTQELLTRARIAFLTSSSEGVLTHLHENVVKRLGFAVHVELLHAHRHLRGQVLYWAQQKVDAGEEQPIEFPEPFHDAHLKEHRVK
jgi:hypothetical protein